MSLELKLLVWSIALAFVQSLVGVLGVMGQVGLPRLAGNRDDVPAIEAGADGRSGRTATCSRALCCSPASCWSRT
jgi:hypothetical protein